MTSVPRWWGMLNVREAVHCVGQGVYENYLLSTHFFCEPKTTLKGKVGLQKKKKKSRITHPVSKPVR